MKNILNILLASLLLFSSFLVACSEDENGQDNEAPSINISSPNSANNYMSGDTVQIEAVITDNDQLHDISAVLTRTHNEETVEVWSYETHSHANTYTLSDTYIVEVPGLHNEFVLTVSASDHNENKGSETASFHVHM